MQATSAKHYGEKDARLEYLSWRVWFMKRNRALAKEERRKRDALLAEEGMAGPVQDEEGASHDGETSDDETIMPVTSTGSKGISFELEKKASQHLDKRKPSLPRVGRPALLLAHKAFCAAVPRHPDCRSMLQSRPSLCVMCSAQEGCTCTACTVTHTTLP